MNKAEKAYLILDDGTIFQGKSFGSDQTAIGEVVFNTGMTGYQEVLTDPSYCGQLITMTYPLIGNYGVNMDDYEAIIPHAFGFIVREHSDYPSNWRSEGSIDQWLKGHGIPGISNIDTRMLTKKIREQGTMKGMIVSGQKSDVELLELLEELKVTKDLKDQVSRVSTKNAFHCPGQKHRVVLVDYGCKAGILRELTNRHCDVRVVPYDTTAEEIIKLNPDGILLSNGPGDPKDVPEALAMINGVLGKIPLFGICLGHQLFALACGGDTVKMKFGHRGANHPVLDIEADLTMMTSQNHGYAVNEQALSGTRLKVTHTAVNDKTVEGLKHLDHPAFSVQFHPEATPGPYDSNELFDRFINLMDQHKLHITEQKKGANQYA
ncbi:carbamoyl phosphate synthase small subunit [Bacillus horti]|uniref:Carbamoyl phosphate synthase small chain n=1 Tax=Caldalkalibacillus horti TaxID=77523 RepID=A0ABT9VX48_9BACI|nr:carbamoyl phosphate synthase small subunit [Bacillus horti]MDQ0165566.1 carbamoyl-phosphate synthase small subunit [Bacillus horti]